MKNEIRKFRPSRLMAFEPVGLHIRQKQLEEELAKIKAEIAESEETDGIN